MKKLKLFNKAWPCLCLFFTMSISSCYILKSHSESDISVKYRISIDVLADTRQQQQLMEALNIVHINDFNAEILPSTQGSPVQRLTVNIVADNLSVFDVFKSKLSASGLMVTSLVKEP